MKIAVIGQHEWYACMGTWVADGFEANGHEVTRVDRKEMDFPMGQDVYLFVDCSEDYSAEIPDKCNGVKVFWSLDSHMPLGAERSVNIARKCDLVFSSNYEHGVKILEKFGIESYLMPVTYSENLVKKDTLLDEDYGRGWESPVDIQSRKKKIAMIGHPNSPERIKLWELINAHSNSFCGKAETKEDYLKIMGDSKIVVNQPTEPWNNILNNRFFEGLANGCLVLQKKLKTDLIERLGFVDGEDFVYWDDFDNLAEKLKFYLGSIKRRESLIRKGQKRVQQYSMKNQCAKVESIILSKFYERL